MTREKLATNKVVALLLLCLGTIVLFNVFDRYLVIGPELLTDNRFEEKLIHWQHSSPEVIVPVPGSGIVVIQSEDPDKVIRLNQTIATVNSFNFLQLSCDTKPLNIPPHDPVWHVAHIMLFSNGRDGQPVSSRPHHLATLTGSHDWEHQKSVFPVYPDSPSVSLYVQFSQTTGTLWVRNMSLRPLAEKRSFRVYLDIAITLWALTCIWIVAPLARSALGNTQRTIVLALGLVVAAGVLIPATWKEHIGRTLTPSIAIETNDTLIHGTFHFAQFPRTPDIFKVGHFILFALLAAAALYRKPFSISRGGIFACLILFAFATEVAQLFIHGRTALLSDVVIDSAGIVLGLMLLRIARADKL